MTGLFAYALGGALQGFGGGLKEQAIAKREAALADLANQRLAQREEADRAFRREERLGSQEFQSAENMRREMVAAEHSKATAPRPMTAEERKQWGISDDDRRPYMMKDSAPAVIGGSGQTINVATGEGSGEYRKALDKKLADRFIAIQDGAEQARGKLATLDALGTALQQSGQTGWGAEALLDVQKAGRTLGLDIGENLDAKETARALGNQLALQLRNPSSGAGMPGAMSDKDREFLVSSVPGLTKLPDGNARLIDFMKRIEQRNIDVARLAQEYDERNGQIDNGFFKELGEWADANPLFPDTKGNRTQSGVQWSIEND